MASSLKFLAQEIKLTGTHFALVNAMLNSTPVAITGQETMIPIKDLMAVLPTPAYALSAEDDFLRLNDFLQEIVCKEWSMYCSDDQSLKFCIISKIEINDGDQFAHYAFTPQFLFLMQGIEKFWQK